MDCNTYIMVLIITGTAQDSSSTKSLLKETVQHSTLMEFWQQYSGAHLICMANARKIVRIIRACELSKPILFYAFINGSVMLLSMVASCVQSKLVD